MAAYAALTSLKYIVDQLRDHPSPPISLDKQQVKSLTEKVVFLQEFLESYRSPVANCIESADPLEMRIADAAYAAEDVIESHIVDMIELRRSTTTTTTAQPKLDSEEETGSSAGSNKQKKPIMSFNNFRFLMKSIKKKDPKYGLRQGMRKEIKKMDLIKKDVMEIKKEKTTIIEADKMQRDVPASGGSSSRSSIMVGFDGVLLEILDKLTGGRNNRQVISIVGMGGIGKTTLAKTVFDHAFVKDHFDTCAWVTISQKYNTKEILCELLSQANRKGKEELSHMGEDELELDLHKYLSYRRFLIVLDDMWSVEAWEKIQHSFPDNNNSSRIVVTTRLSNLGTQLSSYSLKMKFLDEGSSWDLFSKSVFGEESCPPELEETGKQIVENCRGLPLSIVVVGGLLKRVERKKGCWESIRKNTSAVVNSEKEDFCLKILKISYTHLPVYLKPCFLYMGLFEEDRIVRVSTLIKLWASEGFLKQASDKCLETTAKEYLNDLVERNLIIVHELGCTGNIKYCRLHDLLRDLCCREAEKEGFYTVIGKQRFQGLNKQRCVVIRERSPKEEVHDVLRSMPLARSLVCDSKEVVVPLPAESRLLRTLKAYDRDTSGSHDYMFDDLLSCCWSSSRIRIPSFSLSSLESTNTCYFQLEYGCCTC